MEKNVGSADKAVRIIVGSALVLGGLFAPVSVPVKVVMFVFATSAFLTAFFSW